MNTLLFLCFPTMWMRSRSISRRVISPARGNYNGLGLPSTGDCAFLLQEGVGPWPVMAIRTPASELEPSQWPSLGYTRWLQARSGDFDTNLLVPTRKFQTPW
ncbi:hypothetical protein AVEN_179153-1 [Araneus ventricosus]|uniref:Uncharacterized protein n=1 Tax=Araneus ventricosus TaxID=182803 RepID=A0A4Y2TS25_ARAVE|nr:hypothetical protein AVEN_160686-1 [Araneus ventricosus]GBO03042.1 hypothetical protein AVEN_179153-1 [Araneus ventricosus]